MTTFTADIHKFIDKAGANAEAVVRQTCYEIAERVVERTPVDTGYARACWQADLTPQVKFRLSGEGSEPAPAPADFGVVIAQMTLGSTLYLMNNARYIRKLEYGHSAQAPQGMVRRTVAEIPAIVKLVTSQIGGQK